MSDAQRYKVISADNYGRDNVSETMVIGMLDKDGVEKIAAEINRCHAGGDRYYRAVPQSKALYKWEP